MSSTKGAAISTLLLLAACAAHAADTSLWVRPGPSVISEEERAIEPDPAAGIEHAVILVDETQSNDAYGVSSELRHHLRAKVLSNEARSMADVEIFLRLDEKITGWWGKTLLEDGTVLELEESGLVEQEIVKVGRFSFRAMKGALPGVVPGAIIDYGYHVKGEAAPMVREIAMQRRWPVRRFSYRWRPSTGYPSAYLVHGAEGLDVTVSRSTKAVLITARDLPPVLEEPWMPPLHEVRLMALLYYAPGGGNPKHYWKRRARELDRSTRSGPAELADRIVSEMRFTEGAALPDKLDAAYEWIQENVENPLIRRSGDRVSLGPSSVGFLDRLDRLYAQVARRLGARVDVVLAPDWRIGFWEPGLASDWSFDLLLLAIRDPAGSDDEMIFADPGSGLGFGQVPYFASGSVAFLAVPESPQAISIPHSVATQNISRTTGELAFPDGGSSRSESWSRTSGGQAGLVEAQLVSSFPAELRRRELERLCGAGADVEVEQVRHALTHPPLESRLDCESQTHFGVAMVEIDALAVPWAGPWFQGTPYLPAGPRTHPVRLPYPWVEIAELRVRAPRGFRATEPPPAVRFSHEFGKYELSIETDDDGYRVLRALALLAPTIPAERYEDLRQFLEKADRADATTVEFLRSPP